MWKRILNCTLKLPLIILCLFGFAKEINSQKRIYIDSLNGNNKEEFSADSNYSNYTFSQGVDFNHTIFSQGANFDSAIFMEFSAFSSAIFPLGADFGHAKFLGVTSFYNTKFSKEAYFFRAVFSNTASFYKTKFLFTTQFAYSVFLRCADFSFSKFSNSANFSRTTFSTSVDFTASTFLHGVNFSRTNFSRVAYFDQLFFWDSTDFNFDSTRLPDTLDFSYNPRIHNEIDFSSARFNSNKKCNIFLFRSDISKFHMDYNHFKLLFTDPRLHIAVPANERISIYEALLKNFKDRGLEEDHERLDKEYQSYKWSVRPWYTKWFGFFDKWWWNYGYDKWWVFLWTIGFLIFFTSITFLKLNHLQNYVFAVKKVRAFPFTHFKLRLWHSIIYTSAIFFPLSLKRKDMQYESWWIIYVVIVYLAGLLCVAYIANFVLQK